MRFDSDKDTGLYRVSSDTLGLSAQGITGLTVSGTFGKRGVGINGTIIGNAQAAFPTINASTSLTVSGIPVMTSLLGMVEEIDGQWTQPSTGTLTLVRSASYPFSIQSFTAQTSSNSTTSSLTREGIVITGIDNKTINTTEATYFPTSTANVAVGETLRLTSSGSTGAEDLTFTLKTMRL